MMIILPLVSTSVFITFTRSVQPPPHLFISTVSECEWVLQLGRALRPERKEDNLRVRVQSLHVTYLLLTLSIRRGSCGTLELQRQSLGAALEG